jgi:hypothetical protein
MCLGGIIAVLCPPGARFCSFIQHFAARLLFAAVAGELLPDLLKQAPLWMVIGFAVPGDRGVARGSPRSPGYGIGHRHILSWLSRALCD